ncbi:MAG: TIGR01212 family radical SAM protein, partial [Lachnospiraceae bacterium]|nr:TIGR01212 family radical SAM protein [Lachnospiraceae bacterium]
MKQQIQRWGDKPYVSLDYSLKQQYGHKVYRIAIDGG